MCCSVLIARTQRGTPLPDHQLMNRAGASEQSLSRRLASDSVANLVRFVFTALSIVAMTPVSSRVLEPDAFAVWTLIFTVSTYVAIAGAGASTAVTRFVVADQTAGEGATPSILASAAWTLVASASIATLLVSLLAVGTDWIFRETPAALVGPARTSIVLLAAASGIGMIGIALHGYFFALHRAIVPSIIVVITRTTVACGVVIAVVATKSVVWMSVVMLVGAVLSTAATIVLTKRSVGSPVAAIRLVRRSWVFGLTRHSSTIMVWSLAMVAIAGVDVVVVGAYDFESVAAYGIAAQAVSLILGLTNAAYAPLVTVAARRHAERSPRLVAAIMLDFSRIGGAMLVVTSSAMFIAAPWLVELYAGPRYAATAATILRILVAANVLRNSCSALGMTLVATGAHHRVLAPTIIEAIVNVGLSLALVRVYESKGVALATLFAAAVGVSMHLARTVRRTSAFTLSSFSFASQAIGRPAIAALPTAAVFVAQSRFDITPIAATALATIGSAACAWRFSLNASDRARLLGLLHR